MLEGFAIFVQLQELLKARLAYLEQRAPECRECLFARQAAERPGPGPAAGFEEMEALTALLRRRSPTTGR